MELVSDRPKAPLTTTTSIWPAAVVVILAVVVLASFMVINLISDQGVTSTTTTVPLVVGGLATDATSGLLASCQQPDNPPANIAGALLVPVGTRANGATQLPNAGAGDYDCYRPLTTSANYGALLGYYQSHLEAMGWNLFSRGAANGKPQSLFQKSGSDGFYWVVGITVRSSSTGTTSWTFTIYQNSDTI